MTAYDHNKYNLNLCIALHFWSSRNQHLVLYDKILLHKLSGL